MDSIVVVDKTGGNGKARKFPIQGKLTDWIGLFQGQILLEV
jgi:hypothetical protein|tara:strand:- start:15716 stop:15838 length:123 start_codon:yes stop_codon:yes gene_type:complete